MQGGQQDDKNSLAILWIIGSIFVISLIIWLTFQEELKYGFIKIRYWQAIFLYGFFRMLPASFDAIYDMQHHTYNLLLVTKQLNPGNLSINYAAQLSEHIGMLLRFPLSIILLIFCYLMYGRNVKMRYKKIYSMQSLAKQEATTWPQINPVLDTNIVKMDLTTGPWAMSLSPIDFCKRYALITIAVQYSSTQLIKEPSFITVLDAHKTKRVFVTQLGRLWQGPEKMPIHKRALFAVLIARGCRDAAASRGLLNQINKSCIGGKLDKIDFSGCDALWKKYISNIDIQELIKHHAYENTLFMALLAYARLDGVLATSDFIWLKPFDRSFWYVLNTVGRQTPCCEAAGVHAHYLAEKALRRPIGVPLVEEAVKGLQRALDEIKYVPTTKEKQDLLQQYEESHSIKSIKEIEANA